MIHSLKSNSRFQLLGNISQLSGCVAGVSSVSDPKFESLFESPFSAPALSHTWYISLGNHDHRGNVDAQIQRSKGMGHRRRPPNAVVGPTALSDGAAGIKISAKNNIDGRRAEEVLPNNSPQAQR